MSFYCGREARGGGSFALICCFLERHLEQSEPEIPNTRGHPNSDGFKDGDGEKKSLKYPSMIARCASETGVKLVSGVLKA